MTGIHVEVDEPTIAHTYDFLDPGSPIFIDPRQPGADTVPAAAFSNPGMDVIEVTSCAFDLRCDAPGRRGCSSKPYAVQTPGVPELIVIQHERDCPWLAACLVQPGAREQLAAWRMERPGR